ncbi:MAG TPA: Fic family protein [Acidimicrobiales bacterium]|nr:Fic family protein [Acidimicrobiales bacterium]
MNEPEFLTLEDALGIIEALGVGPVRDLGLLDSALARPRSSAFGFDAYETLELKASALLQSLVKNHSLIDGNKRLGWMSTVIFLRLNDRVSDLTTIDAFSLVNDIAAGSLELNEIAHRLQISVRIP